MNVPCSFFLGIGAAILFLCPSTVQANAQLSPAKHHGEQTSFSVEFNFEHPVPLDEAAKEALATSPGLADDLRQKHLAPRDLPDRWFTASKVHLGVGQRGLVVMGQDGLRANNAPFWVLRRTAKRYDLVLDTTAADLEVLKTETNGLRDVKTLVPGAAAYWGSEGFQFDGHHYQVTRHTSQRTGTKIPTDFKGYQTHAPFVQHTASDTSVLAEARTWIWQHWKTRKPFYVTVVAQDEDGNQTKYQLYTSEDSDNPGLVLKIHKSDWAQDSRRRVTDDYLWVANDVERVYPAVDEDHDPQIIPDEKAESPSAYRLGFRDGIFWLATL